MESQYQCLICQQVSVEPIITECGHMFCWNCILPKLSQGICPTCQKPISKESLIPVYLNESPDTRSSVPRPQASRAEAKPNPKYSRFQNTFQFSGDFGENPSISSTLNSFNTMNHNDPRADMLSKLMLIIGLVILLTVLF